MFSRTVPFPNCFVIYTVGTLEISGLDYRGNRGTAEIWGESIPSFKFISIKHKFHISGKHRQYKHGINLQNSHEQCCRETVYNKYTIWYARLKNAPADSSMITLKANQWTVELSLSLWFEHAVRKMIWFEFSWYGVISIYYGLIIY